MEEITSAAISVSTLVRYCVPLEHKKSMRMKTYNMIFKWVIVQFLIFEINVKLESLRDVMLFRITVVFIVTPKCVT